MKNIAVQRHEATNEESGRYKTSIPILYNIAFAIKMNMKNS